MKEPNNKRNRYRRYREAMKAYNFGPLYGLRDFMLWAPKDSYEAIPGQPDEEVPLLSYHGQALTRGLGAT